MTVEPISSMMTVQAQGSAVSRTPIPSQSADVAEAGRQAVQAADKVDKTTNVVENSQEKGLAGSEEQSGREQTSNEQIRKAVEQMNKSMGNSEAIFGVHEDTNRVTIKIVDKSTKEVIKELPPEKTLDMIARIWDMAGLLVDEKR